MRAPGVARPRARRSRAIPDRSVLNMKEHAYLPTDVEGRHCGVSRPHLLARFVAKGVEEC